MIKYITLLILMSIPVFADLNIAIEDKPYINFTVPPRTDYAYLNADNNFTGHNIFQNVTIINYSYLNVTGNVSADYFIGNGALLNVNSSDYWDDLDTPADIDHSDLDNLEWSLSGHSIDGDIDMNDNQLTDMSSLILSGTGYLGDWSGTLYSANTFSPVVTLDQDLGSGTNRWRYLYVQNISTDTIDAYDVRVTGNLTAAYVNGINVSNISTAYVP